MNFAAGGRPEFATNDDWAKATVADSVNEMLAFTQPYEGEGRTVGIASAYFNVGGWQLLSDELKKVGKVRLMLGAEPQRDTTPVVLRPGTVPARRAGDAALDAALADEKNALAQERNLVPFTPQARKNVQDMIAWLRSGKVEVRRYTKEFLHGKAYLIDNPALGVIAGSSNFTFAGLAKNRELNLGQYNQTTIHAVREWFDSLWKDADAFDLAAFYEQQVVPDEPWIVFLRMLWESYGQQVEQDDSAMLADPSIRDLLPFQKDGVSRARRILDKHNGVLIADEVGLGKTYVGGALVKDTVRARQRVLIISPKIIRDSVWKPYVDAEHLSGWVDTISYDDLMRTDGDDKPTYGLPPGRDPDEYALVLLDEAHTVRNSDTGRAKRLVEILKGNPRKQVVLLTATPVNNALGDLHSLLSYFIVHDDEFAEIGIPSLAAHFKAVDKLNPDDLSPEQLFDILDAVAVRRTRRFVRTHYVGQTIDESGTTLVFPEPQVRRVDYDLTPVLEGFFDTFAHALGADLDDDEPDPFYSGEIPDTGLSSIGAERLTLAGYTPSRYRLDHDFKPYEVQVAGLLRSGLLKRFESSAAAFVGTCTKMADTLDGLLTLIEDERYVASGESLRDWLRIDPENSISLDQWRETADYEPVGDYRIAPLLADIRSDIELLRGMAGTVTSGSTPQTDPKLAALSATLVKVIAEAERDAQLRAAATLGEQNPDQKASRDRDDRKVLVFSYYADTIYYLQDNIKLILSPENFDPTLLPEDVRRLLAGNTDLSGYADRFAFVTGSMRKTSGHGAEAGTVTQEQAVQGFAPKTGSPQRNGQPTAEDRYDLLFATDVLAEGVNLQQAHNIVNYDLPWNPMRLVQRHGRVDRIGSDHARVYLWCFFPDTDLDRLLGLETILQRKLTKAAKSIGTGKVLPGFDSNEDVVFNARRDTINKLADGDASLFLGTETRNLISGEEFRALLRTAIENESLSNRLEALPWGVGSGFETDDRNPGFVFCARILNRADEPVYRYVALPSALMPTDFPETPLPLAGLPAADALAGVQQPDFLDLPNSIDGIPVDVIEDTLTALTVAKPPDQRTPAYLPDAWQTLAFKAWAIAQGGIAATWNDNLDTTAAQPQLPPAVREAVRHLNLHGQHRNRDDLDLAIKIYSRGQASRVTNVVRSVMRDEHLTDRNKTDRLLELVNELGLTAPDNRPKRFPIQPDDVHLIAWVAAIPPARSAEPRVQGTATASPQTSPSLEELTGPFYDTTALREWLDLTRNAIERRVEAQSLFGLQTGDGTWVYPAWQFTSDRRTIPHLSDVLRALAAGTDERWTWALWMTAPNEDWDEKPAWRWLADGGDPELVLQEARSDASRWVS